MADDIQTTTSSLRDLNKVTRDASLEFSGFAKTLLDAASGVDGAGKTWTNFSRILSGTALWKVQNYFRGIIGFISVQNASVNKSIQQAKEQEEQRRKTIVNFKSIEKQYASLTKRATQFIEAREKGFDGIRNKQFTEEQMEAIEGTVAYAEALALGSNKAEAYIKGLNEINDGYVANKENYEALVNSMQRNEAMKTSSGRQDILDEINDRKQTIADERRQRRDDRSVLPLPMRAIVASPIGQLVEDIGILTEKFGDYLADDDDKGRFPKRFMQKLTIRYQEGVLKMNEKMKPIMDMAMKYLIIGLFAMMGLIMFMAAVESILGEMEVLNVVTQVQEILGLAVEGINSLVGFISGFVNNDFELAISELNKFINVAFEIFGKVLLVGLSVIIGGVIGLIRSLPKILFDERYRDTALNILGKFMVIFLTAYFIRYLAIKLMEIAAIYALPVLIGVVVGLAILAGLRKMFPKAFNGRATGGLVNENVTLVGESGPELVSLPTGSRVHTNNQTRNMMGSSRNVFNITINARDTSDAELRRIADKIGQLVSRSVNRSTSSRTLR